MLSSSAVAYGYDLDIAAIGDPSIAIGIPGGNELLSFVDAIIIGTSDDLDRAQVAIINTLGPESLVDASASFGNFEMMNRVSEGSGIPVPAQEIERMEHTIEELGIVGFLKF
jgi:hypothetical protein